MRVTELDIEIRGLKELQKPLETENAELKEARRYFEFEVLDLQTKLKVANETLVDKQKAYDEMIATLKNDMRTLAAPYLH